LTPDADAITDADVRRFLHSAHGRQVAEAAPLVRQAPGNHRVANDRRLWRGSGGNSGARPLSEAVGDFNEIERVLPVRKI
jgi:hypothetical protein